MRQLAPATFPPTLLSKQRASLALKLAGEEGFEPPLSVLETDGLPLNLLPYLLDLFMCRVFPARVAKFLGFQTVRMQFPVLHGRVISVLTVIALQRDDFSHVLSSLCE
jgi:hypothetical protein